MIIIYMKVLLMGDLHFGSEFAGWSEYLKSENHNGDIVTTGRTNEVQARIWKELEMMRDKHSDADLVIVNGDVCEGPESKDLGKFCLTTDMMVQCQAAVEYLRDFGGDVYVNQGTDYHSIAGIPMEKYIAEKIGAKYRHSLTLDIEAIRLQAHHHMSASTSTWQYRTTPLARDLVLLALNNDAMGYGDVDVAIRSHVHYWAHVEFRNHAIVLPCWQAMTPYAQKKGMISTPDLGYAWLDVEDDQISVHKHLFKVPLRVDSYAREHDKRS